MAMQAGGVHKHVRLLRVHVRAWVERGQARAGAGSPHTVMFQCRTLRSLRILDLNLAL